MIAKLEDLIRALRAELQEYGEMLARLDCHQDLIVRRQSSPLLQSVADVEAQGLVMQSAREERETFQRELASALNLPSEASFAEITPLLPADYQPLVSALVEENNELIVRIRQRSRQNHLLLARMLEMMQRFMSSLFPGSSSPVYDGHGFVFGPALQGHSLYDAIG